MEDTLMKVYTTLIATLLIIALMTPTVSTQTDRQIDYVPDGYTQHPTP
jgi:hypothetical protein